MLRTSNTSCSPFTQCFTGNTLSPRNKPVIATQTQLSVVSSVTQSRDIVSPSNMEKLNKQLDVALGDFIKNGVAKSFLSSLGEHERVIAMIHPKEMYINVSAADAFLKYVDLSSAYSQEVKDFIHSQIETRTAAEIEADSNNPQKPLQPRFYVWLSGNKVGGEIEAIPTHGHVGETQFGDSSRCELMGVTPDTVLNVVFEEYNKLKNFWDISKLFQKNLVVSRECHIVPTGDMVRDSRIDKYAHRMAFIPNQALKDLVRTLPKGGILESNHVQQLGRVLKENFNQTPITLQAYKAAAGNAGAYVPKTDANPQRTRKMICENFPEPKPQEMAS